MKMRLNRELRRWVLACCAGAAVVVSGVQAKTTLIADGINKDKVTKSSRFYDTGKGYYFSFWGGWDELEDLRDKKGSFSFLGDVYDRLPDKTATTLDVPALTGDSDTCWAQASMNLVEYWHSYYGVFCKDSRKLTYGLAYDKDYLTATGGTLSLKQNMVFLDLFSNDADNVQSYLNWLMLGNDKPYYSEISKKGQGGFWKEYFSGNPAESYGVTSIQTLTNALLNLFHYTKTENGYEQTVKGNLVYVGMDPVGEGEGHAITCHGFELDDDGQVVAMYMTNSDDMEYKLFKLYVKVVNNRIRLYTDKACINSWKYAGSAWKINALAGIRTPEKLINMLATYESKDTPLRWTGKSATWMTHSSSRISQALPGAASGWDVMVDGEAYPTYFLESDRIVRFDDTAESGDVQVSGTVASSEMILANNQKKYTFTGTTNSSAIRADVITATTQGAAHFNAVCMSGSSLTLQNYVFGVGAQTSLTYTSGLVGAGSRLVMGGGAAQFTTLTFADGTALEISANSSLGADAFIIGNNVTFTFSTDAAVLTLGGAFSVQTPVVLVYEHELKPLEQRALISFTDGITDWDTSFVMEGGKLSYSGNTLYYLYLPEYTWEPGNGVWSPGQWKNEADVSTASSVCIFNGDSSYTVTLGGQVTPYQIEVNNESGQITFAGDGCIAGEASLTKRGDGTLIIDTSNTYTGGTRILGGTVYARTVSALGTGGVELNGATLDMEAHAISNAIKVSGDSFIWNGDNYAGALTVLDGKLAGGSVHLAKNASLQGGEVAAVLTGEGGVLVQGNVTISGANSYLGGTKLSSANLITGNNSALGGGSVSCSGTSSISTATGTTLSLRSGISNSGTLTLEGEFCFYGGAITYLPAALVDTNGRGGRSGFAAAGGYKIQLVKGGTVITDSATITHNGHKVAVNSKGLASYYEISDYSLYLVSSQAKASVKAVNEISLAGGSTECDIVSEGGFVALDDDVSGSLTLNGGVLGIGPELHSVEGELLLGAGVQLNLDSSYFQDGTHTVLQGKGGIVFEGELSDCLSVCNPRERQSFAFSLEGDKIVLTVQSVDVDLYWAEKKGAVWGREQGAVWMAETGMTTYMDGDDVFIENGTITIVGTVAPGSITINTTKQLTFKRDKKNPGIIAGETSVLIDAAAKGKVTMNDGNTYTGGTIIRNGTVKAAGASSFGAAESDITITGGTLDLAGKAIANDIVLGDSGSATIKGGTKYCGTFTMDGGTLLKGSQLNIVDKVDDDGTLVAGATISGGTIDGTLSGTGTVDVSGSVTLGTTGKILTNGLNVSGTLTISPKGLAMNTKASELIIDGGSIVTAGKLSTNRLEMTGGSITYDVTKASSLDIKGKNVTSTLSGAAVEVGGSMNVNGSLELTTLEETATAATASLKLYDPTYRGKAVNLTVKGGLYMEGSAPVDDARTTLTLSGKLRAGSLSMENASIELNNVQAPQSIALTDKYAINELNNSFIEANGSMSVSGNLALCGASSISLVNGDKPKALGLTVKGCLDMDGAGPEGDSRAMLALTGTLRAGSLNMENASIELNNMQAPQSIALTDKYATNELKNSFIEANGSMSVSGDLELGSASSISLVNGNKSKALGLTVKGTLEMQNSALSLTGAVTARNLVLDGGVSITFAGDKFQTIKVQEILTLSGENQITFGDGYDFVQDKAYKLLTFKYAYKMVWEDGKLLQQTLEQSDLPALLGLESDCCTLTLNAKDITLVVNDTEGWTAYMESRAQESELVADKKSTDESEDESTADESLMHVAGSFALPGLLDYSAEADAMVQANWGLVETSRAFVNAIGNRSMAVQLDSGDRAVWASAIGGSSRSSSVSGHSGADTNISGGAIGLESRLGESSLLGLALGNSRTRVSAHGYSTIKQDTTHLGLYGKTAWGMLSADWSAAYGNSESKCLGSSWKQQGLQMDGRLSYSHAFADNTLLRGFGGVQYYSHNSSRVDGISTGDVQNLRAEIGLGFVHYTDKSIVNASLAAHQDIVRDNPTVNAPDGCRYRGANPGRFGFTFTVGGSYALTDEWSLNANYSAEIVENATSHSVNAGATYKF